ncbi:hypothetical protein E2N92_08625 [Methanofollis formosanus]|uniref:Uncharacterized protein n=1 Tax=Methanofollis formosanus TaxID=299308 RepID=A0A8G1EG71_9EURY|nr:hypothetical protein [Methanofollis formosanus]QYZ79485.1 hypothetical protein E2N92_08625 [Methanofollis formosanus]
MVTDDSAQLYTIEGFAAAFIILATAYLVGGTMSIYTPGDSHIADMQLEQIGSDVLAVMDTPTTQGDKSVLQEEITGWKTGEFKDNFTALLNQRTSGTDDTLQFAASVSYRNDTDTVQTVTFVSSQDPTGYEQAVRVTRLVKIDTANPPMETRPQVVLLEVLIWRS